MRVQLRVKGLEPESRAPCSSSGSAQGRPPQHPQDPGGRELPRRSGLLSPLICSALLPERLIWLRLGLGCSCHSSAPTLAQTFSLRGTSFLPLLLGLVSPPCCICNSDAPCLKGVLHLRALEPCQRFLEMLVGPASWGRGEGAMLKE